MQKKKNPTKKPAKNKKNNPLLNQIIKSNTKPKNKNISRKIKIGTTLQTRDEYFIGQENYRKPGYESLKNYRKVVVVDSNSDDELAIVKLTTAPNAKAIPDYKKGKSKFYPFIQTKDDKSQPIKIGSKFTRNSKKQNLLISSVNRIKKESLKHSSKSLREENKKKLRELKKRI